MSDLGEQIRFEFERHYGIDPGVQSPLIEIMNRRIKNVTGYVRFLNGCLYVFENVQIMRFEITMSNTPFKKLYIPSKESFFERNLFFFNNLNKIISGKCYFSTSMNSNIVYISTTGEKENELTIFDKILFRRELEKQKMTFTKKLENYWKKYGIKNEKIEEKT